MERRKKKRWEDERMTGIRKTQGKNLFLPGFCQTCELKRRLEISVSGGSGIVTGRIF